MRQKPFEETVTPEQLAECKKVVEEIYYWIRDSMGTPEGERWAAGVHEIVSKPVEKKREREPLTKHEELALEFIREKLSLMEQPTVRDIANAAGLRSSRSGLKLLNSLISKGYVHRTEGVIRVF